MRTSPALWEKLKPLARQMRHEPTRAERVLWERIRNRALLNYKFRRQHTIDRFIVDFLCSEAALAIEVDGEIHQYTREEDAIRQEFLESLGYRVVRFTNEQVLETTSEVVSQIREILETSPTSHNKSRRRPRILDAPASRRGIVEQLNVGIGAHS